ncbi:MAG: hypothetical protein ABSH19_08055, partial [Opitutales bacterium]
MISITYVVAFLAALAALYLRQRRTPAILILLGGILVATVVDQIAPSAQVTPAPLAPPPHVFPAFPLALAFDRIATVTEEDGSKSYLVEGNLSDDILPAHTSEVWFPLASRWTLAWPEQPVTAGTKFLGVPDVNTAAFPATGLPYRFTNALQAFGIKRLLTTIQYDSTTLAALAPETIEQLRQSPAQLDGNLTFGVGRLEEAVRLPLTPGAIYRDGPNATGVIAVDHDANDNQASVTLAEQSVQKNNLSWYDTITFNLLVNPRLGEAVLGYSSMNGMDMVSDLNLTRVQYNFRFQYFTGPGHVHNMS